MGPFSVQDNPRLAELVADGARRALDGEPPRVHQFESEEEAALGEVIEVEPEPQRDDEDDLFR